jgi:50S ribosomal subunit-associated GTPase HflX
MAAVDDLLASLDLRDKPVLMVFNKQDRADSTLAALQCRVHHGVAISAVDESTLPPLIARLEAKVEELLARRETGSPEAHPDFQEVAEE